MIVGILTRMAKKVDINRKFVVLPWLQNGYRFFVDVTDSLKCVVYMDEKCIITIYFHEKLRSGARMKIKNKL